MDLEGLDRTFVEQNARPCPFAAALFSGHGGCSQAERLCIAEREGFQCGAVPPWRRCRAFLAWLRDLARFALGEGSGRAGLSHARSLRLQVGGLRGARELLTPGTHSQAPVADIHACLEAAALTFGRLDALPAQPLIRHIAAFQGRPRLGRRPRT